MKGTEVSCSSFHPSFEERGKRERAMSGSREQRPQMVQQERPLTDEISHPKSDDGTQSSWPFAVVADTGHSCLEGVRLRSTRLNLMVVHNVPATVYCRKNEVAP